MSKCSYRYGQAYHQRVTIHCHKVYYVIPECTGVQTGLQRQACRLVSMDMGMGSFSSWTDGQTDRQTFTPPVTQKTSLTWTDVRSSCTTVRSHQYMQPKEQHHTNRIDYKHMAPRRSFI